MTIINCKKHGRSSFFESCEHVKDLIQNENIKKVKRIRVHIYIMYVCEECIQKHKLEKYLFNFEKNPSIDTFDLCVEPEEFWEHFEKEYEIMKNRIGWCSDCYKELNESYNIK